MKVINDLLGYENIKIIQDDDCFNFSLDSVLLPNFVTIKTNTKKILDLGTGNAPIPLIFSCLNDEAEIYGVEIQKKIYDMAVESVKMNKLENRIKLINDDMKNLDKYFDINSFDIIVSNPPYFKIGEESNLNENIEKTIARHEMMITLDELTKIANKYLKNGGAFAIVHRTERLIEIIETFKKYNIEPKRIRLIYPKQGTESNMVLIEGRKNGKVGLKVLPPLIAHEENGNYTYEVNKYFKKEK
jgi:tRNA1(Val) A37 N6-methylase TrmN6